MFWWVLNTYLLQNTVFSLQPAGKDCWHLSSELTSMWWPRGLTALMLSENISRAFAPGMVQEERPGADLHITFPLSHPSSCPAWILPCSQSDSLHPSRTHNHWCCWLCSSQNSSLSMLQEGLVPKGRNLTEEIWKNLEDPLSSTGSHLLQATQILPVPVLDAAFEKHTEKFLTGKKSVSLKPKIFGLWGCRF